MGTESDCEYELDAEGAVWRGCHTVLGAEIPDIKYILFAETLEIRKGIFSTSRVVAQLYRVEDVIVNRTLLDRIFGVGSVTISLLDRTIPSITLQHVKRADDVASAVLSLSNEVKLKRRGYQQEVMVNDIM